jgi:hypothetical protein
MIGLPSFRGKKAQTVWFATVAPAGGAVVSDAAQVASVKACPNDFPPVGGTPSQ